MRLSRSILWLLPVTVLASAAQGQSSSSDGPPPVPAAPAAAQPVKQPGAPVTFARGGREADAYLVGDGWPVIGENKVVLSAFGRTWGGPLNVTMTSANVWVRLAAPKVRVPTVFAITGQGKRVVGELVAYPEQDAQWDSAVGLYACAAPRWFTEWAAAMGLPVKKVNAAEELPAVELLPDGTRRSRLLVLGRAAADRDPAGVQKLAAESEVNVLVLEASWFGDSSGEATVDPSRMAGGLAEIRGQQWPKPLGFSSHRAPWPGIANRWAWMVDAEGLPLVEEVRPTDTLERAREQQCTPPGPRVVVSYLPWSEQLGRSESADATLLTLLKAAAHPRQELRWRMAEMVWPPEKEVFAAERPVLKAALDAWPVSERIPARLHVLDLRGPKSPPPDLEKALKDAESAVERAAEHTDRTQLLILGDDKVLDEWKWLKLDRAKKAVGRPGVVWLSGDELPPSKENQIRLMLELTELGVPLVPPSEKEKQR